MVVFKPEGASSRASSLFDSDSESEEGGSTYSTILSLKKPGSPGQVGSYGVYRATSVRMPPRVVQISRPKAASRASTSQGVPQASSSNSSTTSSSSSTPNSQQSQFTSQTTPMPSPPAAAYIPSKTEERKAKPAPIQTTTGYPYDPSFIVQSGEEDDGEPVMHATLGSSPTPTPSQFSGKSAWTLNSANTRDNNYSRDYRGAASIESRIASPPLESYEENVLVEAGEKEVVPSTPYQYQFEYHRGFYQKVPTSPSNLLNQLWDITEGVNHYSYPGIFAMNVYQKRPRSMPADGLLNIPEHFIFGSDKSTPFYTLTAHPTHPYSKANNELILSRRNPFTGNSRTALIMNIPEKLPAPHEESDAQNPDMLITHLYPTAAADQALNRAALSDEKNHHLIGSSPAKIAESAAFREALQRECCRLCWDSLRQRYYLYHPGVGDGGEVYLVVIEGQVGFGIKCKGRVKLVDVQAKETISGVDFGTGQLFVDARAAGKVGSRHFVDVAVAAVLTVCAVEGRRFRPFEQENYRKSQTIMVSASTKDGVSTVSRSHTTTKTKSSASEGGKTENEKPRNKFAAPFIAVGKGIYAVIKGFAFVIIFTAGLGYSIIKAIFEAFRPMK